MTEEEKKIEREKIDRHSLAGKLVIAMPHLEDSRFYQSVIFICGHDETGAMGVIINKPLSAVKFTDLLEQLNIDYPNNPPELPINYGGPVEIGRGFVLHSPDYMSDNSTLITDKLVLTATLDVLKAIARHQGPLNRLIVLGYVGWGAFQLEQEIQNNGWIVIDASEELIFGSEMEETWKMAMASIGVDPSIMSLDYGHA